MIENPAVVFPEPGRVELESADVPPLGHGEILIETSCSLISAGTEIAVLNADFPSESAWARLISFPARTGYSNVGRVVEVGDGVDEQLVGRWAATFSRHALYVKADTAATGFGAIRWLPDGVSREEASFFTLAEVAMNGIRRSRLAWGETAVVYGLGVIGQLTARMCSFAGAVPVICVDRMASRLEALPDGPSIIPVDGSSGDVHDAVAEITNGQMADVVFEVTGSPDLIPVELDLACEQGRLVLIGASTGAGTFVNFHDVCMRFSRTIIGAHYFSYPQHADPSLPWTPLRHAQLFFDLILGGVVEVASLVTHRFPSSEAPEAYEILRERAPGVLGVLLEWG